MYAKNEDIKRICFGHGTWHLSVQNKVLYFIGGIYEHMHTFVLKKVCKNYYGVSEACCDWSAHFGIQSKGVLYNAVDLKKIEKIKEKDQKNLLFNVFVINFSK